MNLSDIESTIKSAEKDQKIVRVSCRHYAKGHKPFLFIGFVRNSSTIVFWINVIKTRPGCHKGIRRVAYRDVLELEVLEPNGGKR